MDYTVNICSVFFTFDYFCCFQLLRFKTVDLSKNNFTHIGISYIIGKAEAKPGEVLIESLDLSNCSLGDQALEKISSFVDIVKDLVISDNSFTRCVKFLIML